MAQRAAPAGRLPVTALVVTAHRIAALVEPRGEAIVPAAVFAQAVHDQHGAARLMSRPVAQQQVLAIGHGLPAGHTGRFLSCLGWR